MQIFIHQKRGNPVPKDIVGKAFAYVMRYTESENTRSAFVDLLNNSEEKNNKKQIFKPSAEYRNHSGHAI